MMENYLPEIGSCSPSGLPEERQAVMDELLRGQGLTEKLRGLILAGTGYIDCHQYHPSSTPAEDLITGVLESLDKTISMLSSGDDSSRLGSSAASIKSEDDTEGSCAMSNGRGRYSRRRNGEIWSEITSALVDDGHVWRKYGQKSILNSDFPRSYYRCTHKYDQGCQATKQVQMVSSNPPRYKTTYQAHHICKIPSHAPPIVFDDYSLPDPAGGGSSFVLSFDRPSSARYPFPATGDQCILASRDDAAMAKLATTDQLGYSGTGFHNALLSEY